MEHIKIDKWYGRDAEYGVSDIKHIVFTDSLTKKTMLVCRPEGQNAPGVLVKSKTEPHKKFICPGCLAVNPKDVVQEYVRIQATAAAQALEKKNAETNLQKKLEQEREENRKKNAEREEAEALRQKEIEEESAKARKESKGENTDENN